jgi:apolipoprotein N-acyltransferase
MNLLFVLGNLLGRAMVSYALVWLVCWFASRLSWRAAFARSRRWYSLLAVVALTLVGMGSALVKSGGLP